MESIEEQKRTSKNKKTFIETYKKSFGNASLACEKANVGRSTFYYWMEKDEKFAQNIDEVNESFLDFSESMLLLNVKDRKENSIFFHLNNKGLSRGYKREQHIDHSFVEQPLFPDPDDEDTDKPE